MRIDMRPKVVAKLMSKEILLFIFAMIAAAGMPLYFYKIHGLREEMAEKEYQKVLEKQEKEEEARKHQRYQSLQVAQGIGRSQGIDLKKKTEDKLKERFSEEDMKKEIERAEADLQREALRNERLSR